MLFVNLRLEFQRVLLLDKCRKFIFLARAVRVKTGFVIKAPNYEIEDPIFRHWIRLRVDLRI